MERGGEAEAELGLSLGRKEAADRRRYRGSEQGQEKQVARKRSFLEKGRSVIAHRSKRILKDRVASGPWGPSRWASGDVW